MLLPSPRKKSKQSSQSARTRRPAPSRLVLENLETRCLLSFSWPTGLLQGWGLGSYYIDAVVGGDFNGDGKLDVVAADNGHAAGPTDLLMVPGRGDGTFGAAVATPYSGTITNLVAGDFNGDGKLDVVATPAPWSADTPTLWLGNGDGSFTPSPQPTPSGVVTADLNGDGKLDLVALGDRQVLVSPGNGDGTFQPTRAYDAGVPAGAVATSVVVGDFNGDGKPDLAVANSFSQEGIADGSGSSVSVLLNNGDGTFQAPLISAHSIPSAILVAGDFTGDGKLDLAAVGSTLMNVLRGKGDGTFDLAASQVSIPGPVHAAVSGDFNGDGKLDLAVKVEHGSLLGSPTSAVFVLPGDGTGTFSTPQFYETGPSFSPRGSNSLAVGDFNRDGQHDLVTNHSVNGLSQLLSAPASFTTLSADREPSFHWQNVTFTATVRGSGAGPTPTGTVIFLDGDTQLGSATLGPDGTASLTTFALSLGGHGLQAVYKGDSHFGASTSPPLNHTVNFSADYEQPPGDIRLRDDAGHTVFGQTVTFTVSVTGPGDVPVPTGTITFRDGDTSLGSSPLDENGVARFTTRVLGQGSHIVTAVYSGDNNFKGSTSAPRIHTVDADPNEFDPTFGDGGRVLTDFAGGTDWANALVVQPDGKIIAVGGARDANGLGLALARYNSDGSLDTAFGSRGKVFTSFNPGGDRPLDSPGDCAVALQADGKIIVATVKQMWFQPDVLLLVRYLADGSLDATFGTDGTATFDLPSLDPTPVGLVLQPNGKIVAAATISDRTGPFPEYISEIALVRCNADGSLDETFGTGGKATANFEDGTQLSQLLLQPDGKLVVVAGTIHGRLGGGVPPSDYEKFYLLMPSGIAHFALARFTADGVPDTTFGSGGQVATTFTVGGTLLGAFPDAAVLQPDGKLLVAGTAGFLGAAGDVNAGNKAFGTAFVAARYNADGSLDSTFGTGGQTATPLLYHTVPWPDFLSGAPQPQVSSIFVQPDGKIELVGMARNWDRTLSLFRLNSDGSPDTSFVVDAGPPGSPYDFLKQTLLQADGALLAVGTMQGDFLVERFFPKPPPPAPEAPQAASQLLVFQVSQDLLGRPPDAVELTAWGGAPNEDGAAATVVHRIMVSSAYQTHLIQDLYQQLLGRAAESFGLNAWLGFLTAGHSADEVEAGILASEEYRQLKGGDDSAFLRAVYQDVLHRGLDAVGASAWGQLLVGGSARQDVALGVLQSVECQTATVQNLYRQLLHRPADEDGLGADLAAMQQGMSESDVMTAILSSVEYKTRLQAANGQ
jgi:uncharacterized delta-60 repeat protein